MSKFSLFAPAPQVLVTACIALLAIGFSTDFAYAQATTPSTGGKRRNTHAASSPAPSPTPSFEAATLPTKSSTAITTAAPAMDTEDLEELNEPPPPTDKGTVDEVDPPVVQTEIIATTGATFASKDRIAVFTGDVRVNDPKFKLSSDKLTVFLNKTADKTASPAATPAPATPPPLTAAGAPPEPAATPKPSGGIDHAVAEGHVIIIQERAATDGGEAKRSVGRADWASFDNKTGDMVLKGTPSVEQNGNTHVATSPSTIMTLKRDNSLLTVGPSRTLITQHKGSTNEGFNFGPSGNTASPSPANAKKAAGAR